MFSAELGRPIAFNADDIQAAYRLKKTIEDGLKSLSIKTVAKWWATEYQAIEQNAAASMLALEQALQERRDGELRLR